MVLSLRNLNTLHDFSSHFCRLFLEFEHRLLDFLEVLVLRLQLFIYLVCPVLHVVWVLLSGDRGVDFAQG